MEGKARLRYPTPRARGRLAGARPWPEVGATRQDEIARPDLSLVRSARRLAILALLTVAVASCGKEPTAPLVEPPPLGPEAALAQRLEQGWTSVTPGLRGVSVAVLTRDEKLYTAAVGVSAGAENSPALSAAHRSRTRATSPYVSSSATPPGSSITSTRTCSGTTRPTPRRRSGRWRRSSASRSATGPSPRRAPPTHTPRRLQLGDEQDPGPGGKRFGIPLPSLGGVRRRVHGFHAHRHGPLRSSRVRRALPRRSVHGGADTEPGQGRGGGRTTGWGRGCGSVPGRPTTATPGASWATAAS